LTTRAIRVHIAKLLAGDHVTNEDQYEVIRNFKMMDPGGDVHEYLIEQVYLDRSTVLWVDETFYQNILSVLQQLPNEALAELSERDFKFLAPGPFLGRVTRLDNSLNIGDRVIFLSPELLGRSEEAIRFVIAHELAHVVLGHEEEPCEDARAAAEQDEKAADHLAESWGFRRPQDIPPCG
jgi:hypothetical protein